MPASQRSERRGQTSDGRALAREIAGPILLLLSHIVVFRLLHTYDWGSPLGKLLCFGWIFLCVIVLRRRGGARDIPSPPAARIEVTVVSAMLGVGLAGLLSRYGPEVAGPPEIDIGLTTNEAAEMLFVRGENPYESESISRLGRDPRFWGYHYGPFMILGYGLSAVAPGFGIKLLSAIYLAATVALVGSLVTRPEGPGLERLAARVFAAAVLLLPERVGYELFHQGVNDIFPVALLVGSLRCVRSGRWLPAGVLAGLSFSAKFSPAVFFLLLFVRRRPRKAFFAGAALGLAPLLAFALWDAEALINNVFLFHALKAPDRTSLQAMAPAGLRFLFPLLQLGAVGYVVLCHFNRPIDFREIGATLVLLLIVIEVTYKEIHANHLLWFLPFLAVTYTSHRHRAVPAFQALVARGG